MPARVRALAALALGLAGAACSLTVDFDAFTRGGAVTADATPTDAPLGSDAGAPGDADATAPFEAGAFCPTPETYLVCDDFDGQRDAGWTQAIVVAGGTATTTDAVFLSPPRSLRASRDDSDASSGSGGIYVKNFGAEGTRATVEADVMACSATSGAINLLYFLEQTTVGVNLVTFGIGPNGGGPFVAAAASGQAPISAGAALPTDRFVHVRFTVLFDRARGSLRLEIDGAVRADVVGIPTTAGTVSIRAFQAGVFGTAGPACTAHLDNVSVDVR